MRMAMAVVGAVAVLVLAGCSPEGDRYLDRPTYLPPPTATAGPLR